MAEDVLQRADQMAKQGLISPERHGQIAAQFSTPPVHTIEPGPEYDKWDEALQQHGRIRLPKELDEPQKWLNQDHIKAFIDRGGIDREDRPDGSVILSIKTPTS